MPALERQSPEDLQVWIQTGLKASPGQQDDTEKLCLEKKRGGAVGFLLDSIPNFSYCWAPGSPPGLGKYSKAEPHLGLLPFALESKALASQIPSSGLWRAPSTSQHRLLALSTFSTTEECLGRRKLLLLSLLQNTTMWYNQGNWSIHVKVDTLIGESRDPSPGQESYCDWLEDITHTHRLSTIF